MDIYITDKGSGETLHIPMLPEEIECQTSTRFISFDLMGSGEVKIPKGENLTGFSWSGTLPGLARGRQPYIQDRINPKSVQSMLSEYRSKGALLRLLVTDTPINHDVYLDSYSMKYLGGYGDYSYTISFVVAKGIVINTETSKSSAGTTGSGSSRPSVKAKTYTVKAGDSLWLIAQKQMGKGSLYPKLYDANKTAIDAKNKGTGNPKYTIYPGQVFKIP